MTRSANLEDVINLTVLAAVPFQPQSQCALNDQLKALSYIALRFGLYDAADHLRDVVERQNKTIQLTVD